MTLTQFTAKVAGWAPDAMILAGSAAISYGASLIYLPAGYIVGGLLTIAIGYLAARGAK